MAFYVVSIHSVGETGLLGYLRRGRLVKHRSNAQAYQHPSAARYAMQNFLRRAGQGQGGQLLRAKIWRAEAVEIRTWAFSILETS